jgi:hypothetical protein
MFWLTDIMAKINTSLISRGSKKNNFLSKINLFVLLNFKALKEKLFYLL